MTETIQSVGSTSMAQQLQQLMAPIAVGEPTPGGGPSTRPKLQDQLLMMILQMLVKLLGGDPTQAGAAPGTPAGGGAPAGGAPAGGAPAGGAPAGGTGGAPAGGEDISFNSNGGDLTPSMISEKYSKEIAAASEASGIPPDILAGMIWQESKGRPVPGGGLMQIQGAEFEKYGGGDVNNPADNIMAGAMYMKDLTAQYGGDIELGLRAYNSGPNGVDPNDVNATPAGTGDPTYVGKVLKAAAAA